MEEVSNKQKVQVPNCISDSQINVLKAPSSMYAHANVFEQLFDDEISLEQGECIEILKFESTKLMCKVKTKKGEGWVPSTKVNIVDPNSSAKDQTDIVEVPRRIEQLYRQRRIAQMMEKIKGVDRSQRKVGYVVNENTREFCTKVAFTISPHQSKVISVSPVGKCEKFCLIEPNSLFKTHAEMEVLDGSYYESKVGYMVVRNTTDHNIHLKKGTAIGIGAAIELRGLPFMSEPVVSIITMNPKVDKAEFPQECSEKEQSRQAFLEKNKRLRSRASRDFN